MIPTQIAPAYILTALILLLWLIEGRFCEKWEVLRREPLFWIFAAYYGVFLLSLLWTSDMPWGWRMVKRQNFFLLFVLYFTVARPEHFMRYVSAFLLSIAMCEVLAYYNWADLYLWPELPDGINADKGAEDTAPFVDRILYTPALALAGYLAGHQVLFGNAESWKKRAYGLLLIATIGNLLFSGGRAGLVGFLVLLTLLVFQYFKRRRLMAVLVACLLTSSIVIGGYASSDYFQKRVDQAVDNITHYETKPNTSVGLRITYTMNAWRMFIANPLIGVGAGDYPAEYEKINERYTPQWEPAWNPHNQYLLALTSAGVIGGMVLALVLFMPLFRHNPEDGRERIRLAVPILLITICLFESYLMRSNTSLMYVVFTAALWRGVQEKKS
ncbi:MAG: O-antigen ligase family protein [Burkholderiaceae bacterium]